MSQSETVPDGIDWIRFISPFFYAFESIMVNDMKGETCFFAPRDADGTKTSMSIPLQCEQYLFNMGLEPQRINFDVAMLGLWTLLYIGASFLFLVMFVRGKR